MSCRIPVFCNFSFFLRHSESNANFIICKNQVKSDQIPGETHHRSIPTCLPNLSETISDIRGHFPGSPLHGWGTITMTFSAPPPYKSHTQLHRSQVPGSHGDPPRERWNSVLRTVLHGDTPFDIRTMTRVTPTVIFGENRDAPTTLCGVHHRALNVPGPKLLPLGIRSLGLEVVTTELHECFLGVS